MKNIFVIDMIASEDMHIDKDVTEDDIKEFSTWLLVKYHRIRDRLDSDYALSNFPRQSTLQKKQDNELYKVRERKWSLKDWLALFLAYKFLGYTYPPLKKFRLIHQ